jgi:SRSO17 transposase
MDATQILSLRPRLAEFLEQFASCFRRSDTRGHLSVYVEGQLSDLPRKNCEPMADARGIPPRTLQQFLSLLEWDHELLKAQLQQCVARDHASLHSVGIIDESGCAKKGQKTPGVQRQWCGATGKADNCIVTVHLGYAVDEFQCLLDSELFLPESWSQDRDRCRAADIPDDLVYRPKTQIALELYDRARANGVSFAWLTFDEGYGKSPAFLEEIRSRGQQYVAEVPVLFTGWLSPPQVLSTTLSGRQRKVAKLIPGSRPALSVADHLKLSPALRDQPWQAWRVKEGAKGPMVWEVKHAWFYPRAKDGRPLEPVHLIVARSVLEPEKLKFFLAHASCTTPLSVLLGVAFSRWHVERCFEDQKTELGFDHFEGRSYVGLMRHQILTAVTHLFLSRMHWEWRGKKSGADRLSNSDSRCSSDPNVVAERLGAEPLPGSHRRQHPSHPSPQRALPPESSQTDPPPSRSPRNRPSKTTYVRLG